MKLMYVPCKTKEEARSISKALISQELCVCANIFPIQSAYQNEGSIVEDEETVMLLKVVESKVEEAKQKVKELHSYDTPFIGVIDAYVNKEYLKWAGEENGA